MGLYGTYIRDTFANIFIKCVLSIAKKKFLILNGLAILFISLSFYIKGGMVGAYTEAVMLTIHIIAYITTLEFQRKISILAPLISFSIFFTLTNTQFQVIPFLEPIKYIIEIFMPIAITFFVYGVFQSDMQKNKLIFLIGLFFLMLYSIGIQSYYIAFTNFLGIILLLYRYNTLRKARKNGRDNN